jgi:IS30 family transposase
MAAVGVPIILHISDRPAEAEDRAVPGHWEGDLVFGKAMSPIATLVERSMRFLILVGLPGGDHKAEAVADALAAAITTLPKQLTRSLTGDQGHEMAAHHRFTIETGVQVYFCDPESPWQRQQREHQRPAAPMPASAPRLSDLHPRPARRDRPRAQRKTSTDLGIQDTITSTGRGVALTA